MHDIPWQPCMTAVIVLPSLIGSLLCQLSCIIPIYNNNNIFAHIDTMPCIAIIPSKILIYNIIMSLLTCEGGYIASIDCCIKSIPVPHNNDYAYTQKVSVGMYRCIVALVDVFVPTNFTSQCTFWHCHPHSFFQLLFYLLLPFIIALWEICYS